MAVQDRRISNEEGSGPSPEAPALQSATSATNCRMAPTFPGSCLKRYSISHRGRELARSGRGLVVYMTAEVPANIELADVFSERFDGFSVGTNDLTQITLGVDRDSERLSELFYDHHQAINRMIARLIETALRVKEQVARAESAGESS